MSVQYAGNPFMSRRLIEVIQELRGYLGPEAQGLSNLATQEGTHPGRHLPRFWRQLMRLDDHVLPVIFP